MAGYLGSSGAISTAALLMDEGHKLARYRYPVELNRSQSDVLRRVLRVVGRGAGYLIVEKPDLSVD